MKPSAILIGLAAGFAAALLFAGLILQSTTALVLSLATPIPIYIASLGWGSRIGFLAAITAACAIAAVTGSFGSGMILFGSMALPAAILGHLAGLARPSDEAPPRGPYPAPANDRPGLDWYPLDRILFVLVLTAIVACLFIGWLFGYNPAALAPQLVEALSAQMNAGNDPAAQQQIQILAQLVIRLMPFVQPALLVVVLVAGLHLSAAVTRLSGRLPRPKDDIPATSGLPRVAMTIFAVALAACFAPDPIATIAAVVAGSFGTAFTLVGLASLHRRTRGNAHRGFVLFSAYVAIVLLSFPLLLATVLGLFETARRAAGPRGPQ
jgi:hypothetical protein